MVNVHEGVLETAANPRVRTSTGPPCACVLSLSHGPSSLIIIYSLKVLTVKLLDATCIILLLTLGG